MKTAEQIVDAARVRKKKPLTETDIMDRTDTLGRSEWADQIL